MVEWRRSARGEQELGAHPNRRMANDKVSISMCEKKKVSEKSISLYANQKDN